MLRQLGTQSGRLLRNQYYHKQQSEFLLKCCFSTNIVVPSMGDSISEGTVVEWLKQVGDPVQVDDVVVVLETDKVSVDVRSSVGGILEKQEASVDDTVNVGAVLAIIDDSQDVSEGSNAKGGESSTADESNDSSDVEESSAAKDTAGSSSGEPVRIVVPSMGDSISEGTVVEWMVSVGDKVQEDDVLVVVETDKVSVDVRATHSGTVLETLVEVNDVVEIGNELAVLEPGHVESKKTEAKPAAEKEQKKEDGAASKKESKVESSSTTQNKSTEKPSTSSVRGERREKMSRMRLRIAERLKESQNTAASLTTFQECDMGKLMAMRKKYKEHFETQHGVKLGFMSAFVKASSEALLEVPSVNAYIDDDKQEMVYRDYVDMSVAVSTPKGLVTPVLQDTHLMSFADIEKTLASLAAKGRDGTLTLEEMTGGNFTISNGGVFGSLMGTPILNRPQSAILGMHATKNRPVVLPNGEIASRPMMYLALTYDHRIIDGREAVTCLKSIANKIEDPERMLLHV